jgi:hypothetical protein
VANQITLKTKPWKTLVLEGDPLLLSLQFDYSSMCQRLCEVKLDPDCQILPLPLPSTSVSTASTSPNVDPIWDPTYKPMQARGKLNIRTQNTAR